MTTVKPHVIYLHGFGSSPKSAKAEFVRSYLGSRAASFTVPRLDGDDFAHLTFDGIRERALSAIAKILGDEPLLITGSSLGGYTAAWLAARGDLPTVDGLLLLAPAFGFPHCWRQLLGEAGLAEWRERGTRPFYHHGLERDIEVWSGLLDSCEALPDLPEPVSIPTAVVHGRQDATVPWEWSQRYADQLADIHLTLVDDEHRLDNEQADQAIRESVDLIIDQMGAVLS